MEGTGGGEDWEGLAWREGRHPQLNEAVQDEVRAVAVKVR